MDYLAPFILPVSIFVYLIGFGLAAYFDYKKWEIPDLLTASLWLFMAAATPDNDLRLAIVGFAFIYTTNSVYFAFKKQPLFQWGDVLLLPVFAVALREVLTSLPIFSVIDAVIMLSILGGIRLGYRMITKEKFMPIGPLLFAAYLLACVLLVIAYLIFPLA